MKKLSIFIICILLSLSISACNQKTEKNKTNATLVCDTDRIYIQLLNQNIKTEKLDVNYPKISGLKNSYIQNKINNFIRDTAFTAEELNDISEEDFEKTKITVDYDKPFLNNGFLSIKFKSSFYFEGMTNPSNYITSLNVNLNNGKIYSINDIFKKNSSYKEKINAIINKQIKYKNISTLKAFEGIKDNQKFYLIGKGIVIYFQEYEYTSHSYGPLEFIIPYNELNDLLKIWIN